MFNRLEYFLKSFNTLYFSYLVTAVGFIITAVFIWVLWDLYSIGGDIDAEEMAQTGQVGDFFGGVVGSIWALAGVFLYFSAIKMQRKELSNQIAAERENRYAERIRQLENTFFNLLSVQHNIKKELSYTFRTTSFDGREVKRSSKEEFGDKYFQEMKTILKHLFDYFDYSDYVNDVNIWKSKINSGLTREENLIYLRQMDIVQSAIDVDVSESTFRRIKSAETEKEKCKLIYSLFYIFYEDSMGHYCRHLYNIVKYIDSTKRDIAQFIYKTYANPEERREKMRDLNRKINCYVAFLQSSLSAYELTILFYNCTMFDKAKRLYQRYNLLENLQDINLFKYEHKNLLPGIKCKSSDEILKGLM